MIKLCHIDEIEEGQSRGFDINQHSLFAIKKDCQIYVYRNHCPHLGVELNWQEDQFLDMDGALIQCSSHGALFLIESGECVSGPCINQQLQAIPFSITDGTISVEL